MGKSFMFFSNSTTGFFSLFYLVIQCPSILWSKKPIKNAHGGELIDKLAFKPMRFRSFGNTFNADFGIFYIYNDVTYKKKDFLTNVDGSLHHIWCQSIIHLLKSLYNQTY